ncbi:10101_t:CDS:2, partial [Acaulospora colombiana]
MEHNAGPGGGFPLPDAPWYSSSSHLSGHLSGSSLGINNILDHTEADQGYMVVLFDPAKADYCDEGKPGHARR